MMKDQNPGSSSSQTTQSTHSFLQNSTLLTQRPAEQRPAEVKRLQPPLIPTPKQQSTPTPASASGGQVTLDFTIRFTDLTFGALLGQGGYGKVFA
ncbi:MAG: hypothetical protein JSR33_08095, partial [Proteobacteria bacterium]|nr:hypothetical protein [Pseudomonadota bacterium]